MPPVMHGCVIMDPEKGRAAAGLKGSAYAPEWRIHTMERKRKHTSFMSRKRKLTGVVIDGVFYSTRQRFDGIQLLQ
eukprot:1040059-Pelagomonas_calceolata.AAC.3